MRTSNRQLLLLGLVLLLGVLQSCSRGADGGADLISRYAGLERREIKTLSDDDIHQLQNGEGWGLALAAELNGLPGPLHLLEMAEQDAIHFSDQQLDQIRSLRAEMKTHAIPLGERLIEQERDLNLRFATGDITEQELQQLLSQIGETTAQLRYAHLVTHLKTVEVLTPHQIAHYNSVRGYLNGDSGGEHGHQPDHRH